MELPRYLQIESNEESEKSIFDLNLEQLVYEKMFIMFELLQPAQKRHDDFKVELQVNKDRLLLETDFKEVLGETRPTVAMKEAYMKPLLADIKNKIDVEDEIITFYLDKIAIINDLIKNKRLMLEIENSLK